jgi:hypothetical protein
MVNNTGIAKGKANIDNNKLELLVAVLLAINVEKLLIILSDKLDKKAANKYALLNFISTSIKN